MTPWYKQFWPWFFIMVPVITFTMGGVMLYLAISTQDSLVVDDYYKQGKAINASLARQQRARDLGLRPQLQIADGSFVIRLNASEAVDGQALRLTLYHTTLQARDISLLLTRDATGRYRGYSEKKTQGKWRITLEPVDNSWKVEQQVVLPVSAPVVLEP
ncbi:FixH family protein [Salinimonas lutimaris]|uniref:FixH family protein n=1 Tax=Salinimonas lutimaris TaxID=914153 RepID=UPI001E46041C|nr:FixH family protein [Salinimonas lutimaris]